MTDYSWTCRHLLRFSFAFHGINRRVGRYRATLACVSPLLPTQVPERHRNAKTKSTKTEASHDRSISSPIVRSPRELSPELGGLESSSGVCGMVTGDSCRSLFNRSSHCRMLLASPPSTTTSPCSVPLPRTVPLYFVSSSALLCLFFRAAASESATSNLPQHSRRPAGGILTHQVVGILIIAIQRHPRDLLGPRGLEPPDELFDAAGVLLARPLLLLEDLLGQECFVVLLVFAPDDDRRTVLAAVVGHVVRRRPAQGIHVTRGQVREGVDDRGASRVVALRAEDLEHAGPEEGVE